MDIYNIYSLNVESIIEPEKDKVDKIIEILKKENSYAGAKGYLRGYFGDFENDKWFEYPELNKTCYVLINDEKVEFCAEKNHQQYYGKGWLKLKGN